MIFINEQSVAHQSQSLEKRFMINLFAEFCMLTETLAKIFTWEQPAATKRFITGVKLKNITYESGKALICIKETLKISVLSSRGFPCGMFYSKKITLLERCIVLLGLGNIAVV